MYRKKVLQNCDVRKPEFQPGPMRLLFSRSQYNGAGVMVFMRDCFGSQWLALGREYWGNRGWCDFGGHIHTRQGECVLDGAARELAEESVGTIFRTMDIGKTSTALCKTFVGTVSHFENGINYCMLVVQVDFDATLPRRFQENRRRLMNAKHRRVFLEKDIVILIRKSAIDDAFMSGKFVSKMRVAKSDYITHVPVHSKTDIRIDLRQSFASLLANNWTHISNLLS
jgi:hypothetical protein